MTPSRPVSIYPILSINFVGSLGFSIVLPFLVFLVTRWGGNALVYGLVGATYSIFQWIGAPILGRWSDVYGRKRILLLSQIGTLVSWFIFLAAFALPVTPLANVDSKLVGTFAVTLPLIVLFFARALDGITGGNVSVAHAYLADITPDQDRNASFGKMSVSANLGFILGPAIAGILGASVWGELLPVLAAIAVSMIATVIIAWKLPESSPCVMDHNPEQVTVRKVFGHEQRPCVEMKGAEKVSLTRLLQLEKVPLLLGINFLVMLGFNFFYIAFPVYAATTLEWTVTDTGIFFGVMSLLMVLVQGPLLGRLSRRVSEESLVVMGSLILGLSFPFFVGEDTRMIYLGAALLALGNGLMWPSMVSLLSKAAGRRHQGAVQGFAGSAGAVASIVGLLTGGVLFGVLGGRTFFLSSGVILLVFLMSIRLLRPGFLRPSRTR